MNSINSGKQYKQCKQCTQCIARCYLHLWWYFLNWKTWEQRYFLNFKSIPFKQFKLIFEFEFQSCQRYQYECWILNCPIVREERPARFQVNLILRAPSRKTKRENQWHQWSTGHFSFLESIQNIKTTVCNFEKGWGILNSRHFGAKIFQQHQSSDLFRLQTDSFWCWLEIP